MVYLEDPLTGDHPSRTTAEEDEELAEVFADAYFEPPIVQITPLPDAPPPEALILLLGPAATPLDHAVFAPGPPIGRVVTRSLPTAPGAPPAPPRAASARMAGTAVVVTGLDPPPEQAAAWLKALLAAVPAKRVVAVGSIPAREYGGDEDPSEACVVHSVVDSKEVLDEVAKKAGVKDAALYKYQAGKRADKQVKKAAAADEKRKAKQQAAKEAGAGTEADAAKERGTKAADAAKERGTEAADAAKERGTEAADAAKERGTEEADATSTEGCADASSPSPPPSSWPDVSLSPARSPSPSLWDPSLSICPPPLPPGTLVSGTAAVAARLPGGAAVLAVLPTPTPDRSLAAALARAVEVFVPEGALKEGGTEVRAAVAASAADAAQRVSDLAGMYA